MPRVFLRLRISKPISPEQSEQRLAKPDEGLEQLMRVEADKTKTTGQRLSS